MSRRLLLVLALVGCDRVFGLERDVLPAVCGPFGTPEPVLFDEALGDASDLSFDATGTFGLVYANLGNTGVTPWLGPHAVKRDGMLWVQDPDRDRPQLTSYDGAHITATGTGALGWIDSPRGPIGNVIAYTSNGWNAVVSDVLETRVDMDIHFGNVIDLPVGTGLVQRFAVEIRLAFDRASPGELRILQRIPTSATWSVTAQADPLAAATPALDMNGGVMTADHEILVYTATLANEHRSRIFASQRSRDTFSPGVELVIDGVKGNASITEPWINEDCTQLTYREGGTTWVTNAQP